MTRRGFGMALGAGAAAVGLNFIIAHEPTFWNHMDETAPFADDPVYAAKRRFAVAHKLVVWRFHDMWHSRRPDPVFTALAEKLGWGDVPSERGVYTIPTTTLSELGRHVVDGLGSANVRVAGDAGTAVSRVGFTMHRLSGAAGQVRRCDALLMGEPREFDTFEYFRDAGELGAGKGMVAISHENMEEWGMLEPCAAWVRGFVSEVKVEGVAAGEAYWVL